MIISCLLHSSQHHVKTVYLAQCLQHPPPKKESVLASMCPDGANKRETRWLWVRSQLAWEVSVPFVTSQGVGYMLLHVLAQALWLVDWAKQQTHIVREHYKRCFERNINMYFCSPAGNFLNLPTDNKKRCNVSIWNIHLCGSGVYYASSCKKIPKSWRITGGDLLLHLRARIWIIIIQCLGTKTFSRLFNLLTWWRSAPNELLLLKLFCKWREQRDWRP